jgi:AcrR family transcriptional regulator
MVLNDDRPQYTERRDQLLLVARRIFAERGF